MYPLTKTFQSLIKAKLFGLMFISVVLAIAALLFVVGGITWLTAHFIKIETGWLDGLVSGLAGALYLIIGWFLLPAFTVLIAGLFQDKAIARVERVYYPQMARKEEFKFWPDFWHDVKFTAWALFLNILALPLYFFLIGPVVSILLNSYLLGREFFESAAGYHLGKVHAREFYHHHRGVVYGGGLAITSMTLIPLLNLFVPLIAVVWMVHVYHELQGNAAVADGAANV